jgi:hypothetical protein
MRIEYENKFSDLLCFQLIHQFLSPIIQGLFLVSIVFIFWSELHFYSHGKILVAGLTAFLWYIGLWLFQVLYISIYYLFSKKNTSFLTKHIVETQNDAFYEETKYNKTFSYWSGITSVVLRPGFVAVYISPHLAHIIPNRAFTSDSQRTEFLALVKEKIHAHKQSKRSLDVM